MKHAALLAIFCFGVAVPIGAQGRPAAAEGVMRAFLAAVEAGSWMEAARWVEPALAIEHREQIMAMMRQTTPFTPVTPQVYLRTDSTMPREVAEWMARQHNERSARGGDADLFGGYARVRDSSSLMALSPVELVARALEAQDFRYMLVRAAERDPRCSGLLMAVPPPPNRRELLGVIERGDTAWAVHREILPKEEESHPAAPFGQPMLAGLARRPEGWLILADHELMRSIYGSSFVSCDPMTDTVPPGR